MKENIFKTEEIKKKFNLDMRHAKTFSTLLNGILRFRTSNMAVLSDNIKSKIKQESMYRKLQRFMSSVELDEKAVSELIMEILKIPDDEKLILVLDRTYWMRGRTHLNFLYLSIYYRGFGVPIYFKQLEGIKGHSSVSDRKELFEKFISAYGIGKIAYITADREFDGNEWLSYLESNDIEYVQRLKDKVLKMTNSRGSYEKAEVLCRHVCVGDYECFGKRKIYQSHGFETQVTVAKSPKNEIILLAHSEGVKDPTLAYRLRWGIECGFKSMKSGGFNMDATHLTKPKRIGNMYKIIAILMAFTLKLGVLIDEKAPIKIKKHGRKAKSFIRCSIQLLIALKGPVIKAYKNIRPIIISYLKSISITSFLNFCHVR